MSGSDPIQEQPRHGGPGRWIIVGLLLISLLAAGLAQYWAVGRRDAIRNYDAVPGVSPAANDSALSNMPSFATALLLGGLRGPLVMILWTSSEDEKNARDLEDFDTMVEWIRLLQPQFDTVHLFQIWNKAWNISVQMASLRNKYTTILDAIDYGLKVDRQRPDDLSILTQIGMVYGDKLGSSTEHAYYRGRVRRETQTLSRLTFPFSPDAEKQFRTDATAIGWIEDDAPLLKDERTGTMRVLLEKTQADELAKRFKVPGVEMAPETRSESQARDPSWRRVRLDPMLDENGRLLPVLLKPRYLRPANLPADQPWYDGSPMQCLAPYDSPDGFPYGISTMALAFDYYKRSQLLLSLWNEHHLQMGDSVIDGHPALALKEWAEDERERGTRSELRMWGYIAKDSTDPFDLEKYSAGISFTQVLLDPVARRCALYSYKTSARLYADSRREFQRHDRNFPAMAGISLRDIDDTISGEQMMLADRDYLAAMTTAGGQRAALLRTADAEYSAARVHYAVTILRYFVDNQITAVYPMDPKTHQQYTRATINSADPQTILGTLAAVEQANVKFFQDPQTHQYVAFRDQYRDDRPQYETFIGRCSARLGIIAKALPGTTAR